MKSSLKETSKSSKIISTSDYFNRISKNEPRPKAQNFKKSNQSNLPNEVLVKVFDYLSITDLFKCSLVCKQWYDISNMSNFWIRWARVFKCENEFNRILNNTNFSHKVCFKKIYEKKLELAVFKLNQKLSKKINKYTNLPDLGIFKTDLDSSEWSLEFYDKREKLLFILKTYEQNNFEAGFSVVWSELPDIDDVVRNETIKIRLYASVPFYIDLKSGSLINKKTKYSSDNINNKSLVKEIGFSFSSFKNSKVLYEDKIIEIHNFAQMFLFAFWKTNEQKKQLAFISAHMVFDFDLAKNIFPSESQIKESKSIKKDPYADSELDSQYGLHDYKVYLCIRNQTKTIFLSHTATVYKASFKKYQQNERVYLNVLDCDMVDKVGPILKMLPKFTWKSLINPKNDIDLFSIVDFCLFDSNNRLIISQSFPINFASLDSKQSNSENFVVNQDLKTEFVHESFVLKTSISTLRDEFSIGSDVSYYLTNFEIYLPLEFVNQMFGTKFQNKLKK